MMYKINYKYLVGKFSLLHMGCSGQNGLGSPDGQTRIIVEEVLKGKFPNDKYFPSKGPFRDLTKIATLSAKTQKDHCSMHRKFSFGW